MKLHAPSPLRLPGEESRKKGTAAIVARLGLADMEPPEPLGKL